MTELMMKMTSWLLASMFLGFIVAWFLSRIIFRRKQNSIEDMFDATIVERNNTIDELEKKIRKERGIFETVSNELENSKEALAEKTSLLETFKNRFENNNSGENINEKLEEIDRKRVLELKGFEEVLVLAEDKIEENEKLFSEVVEQLKKEMEILTLENEKDKKSIKLYEKRISTLKEELKLYQAEKLDTEFIISKDQFLKIEEQLRIYQKEIVSLKNENAELLVKLEKKDTRVKA